MDGASGYPLRFEVQGGIWKNGAAHADPQEYASQLHDQPYLRGKHLKIEEPHVYADIMDLVDAIRENRAPRTTGEQTRHVVEIIEKSYAAAKTGQAQTLTTTFQN